MPDSHQDEFDLALAALVGFSSKREDLTAQGSLSETRGEAYFQQLATVAYDGGLTGSAADLCRRRVARAPDDALAWSVLGWTLYCLQDYSGSEKALYRALTLLPDRCDLWIALGQALRHQASPLGDAVLFDIPLHIRAAKGQKMDRGFLRRLQARSRAEQRSLAFTWRSHVPPALKDAAL